MLVTRTPVAFVHCDALLSSVDGKVNTDLMAALHKQGISQIYLFSTKTVQEMGDENPSVKKLNDVIATAKNQYAINILGVVTPDDVNQKCKIGETYKKNKKNKKKLLEIITEENPILSYQQSPMPPDVETMTEQTEQSYPLHSADSLHQKAVLSLFTYFLNKISERFNSCIIIDREAHALKAIKDSTEIKVCVSGVQVRENISPVSLAAQIDRAPYFQIERLKNQLISILELECKRFHTVNNSTAGDTPDLSSIHIRTSKESKSSDDPESLVSLGLIRAGSDYIHPDDEKYPMITRHQIIQNLITKIERISEHAQQNLGVNKNLWGQNYKKELLAVIDKVLEHKSIDKYDELDRVAICVLNTITIAFAPIKYLCSGSCFFSSTGKSKEAVQSVRDKVVASSLTN